MTGKGKGATDDMKEYGRAPLPFGRQAFIVLDQQGAQILARDRWESTQTRIMVNRPRVAKTGIRGQ